MRNVMAKRAPETKKLHEVADPGKDSPQVVRANINRVTAPAASFVSLYVNDTQVQVSPWDIRLILGVIESVPSPQNPAFVIKQVGEVRMSPQHAKKVAQVLANQIALYEKQIGPISLPED
jgi:hypothetical protein